jgi:hypothetical protein
MEFLKTIFCFPFTKNHLKNENVIINNINTVNSNYENDKSNNSNNLNDDYLGIYEQLIFNRKYGLCHECSQPNTFVDWCKECYSKKFQQNFDSWTSGSYHIDKFILESQLDARNVYESFEWIPYSKLKNIKFLAQGGFSTVYEAIWLDGRIDKWDYERKVWERFVIELDERDYEDAINPKIKNPLKNNEKYGYKIAIKSLDNSSNINENFLNEVCGYI